MSGGFSLLLLTQVELNNAVLAMLTSGHDDTVIKFRVAGKGKNLDIRIRDHSQGDALRFWSRIDTNPAEHLIKIPGVTFDEYDAARMMLLLIIVTSEIVRLPFKWWGDLTLLISKGFSKKNIEALKRRKLVGGDEGYGIEFPENPNWLQALNLISMM